MIINLLSIITIILYCTAAGLQLGRLLGRLPQSKIWLWVIGLLAIIIHAYLLHRWIDIGNMQNLSLFTVYSQVTWIIAVIISIFFFIKPVDLLAIISFPLAALSIILVWLFPVHQLIDTLATPKQLFHILLAFLTISVLCLAACQAIFLALQERLLRKNYQSAAVQSLPPIEAMEKLLFRIIIIGFILLTLVLISSLLLFPDMFIGRLWQHTFLGLFAWIVFAILIYGRYALGWRSRIAIRWTLTGVVILFISYFGVQLLLDLYG
ncbi:MAG: cytochrome c biogenesis protein CcsA [Pseudomonadota bacterium]